MGSEGGGNGDGEAVPGGLIILLVLGTIGYFVPLMVAAIRHVPNLGSVAVVNIFLGWSVVGWIIALAMAVRTVPKEHLARNDPKAFEREGLWWIWDNKQLMVYKDSESRWVPASSEGLSLPPGKA